MGRMLAGSAESKQSSDEEEGHYRASVACRMPDDTFAIAVGSFRGVPEEGAWECH